MWTKLFHKWLNPHCPDCSHEYQTLVKCESCEVLKQQLAIANLEKKQLLDSILIKPQVNESSAPVSMTPTKQVTWKVRQQMLEAEDRAKARLMKESPKPLHDIDDLEQEVVNTNV